MRNRYDVENYQRIEKLIDKKLDAYTCDESMVLVLLERVTEAQRIAQQQLKEEEKKGKKKGREERRRNEWTVDERREEWMKEKRLRNSVLIERKRKGFEKKEEFVDQ